MTTLNETGRKRILDLVNTELHMLLGKAQELSERHWLEAEVELSEQLGMSDELTRMVYLRDQINEMQAELQGLENKHEWRGQVPSEREYHEVGFTHVKADQYGRTTHYGAAPAKVFAREIRSKWDLAVFKLLNEKMQLLKVHTVLHQVAHAVEREVAMAGTYRDARESYNQFYQLLRKSGGDDMPPLLSEIVDMPELLAPGQQPRQLEEGAN